MLERFEGEKGPPEELQAEPLGDHRSQWYVSEARTGRVEGGGSSLTQAPKEASWAINPESGETLVCQGGAAELMQQTPRPVTGSFPTGAAAVTGSFPVYGSDTTLSNLSLQQVQAILAMPQQASWLPGPQVLMTPEQKVELAKSIKDSATTSDALTQTLTERGSRYGKFKDLATVTQRLKAVLRDHMGPDKWDTLTPSQAESLEMVCHKLGRIANGDPNYADSWVDIAGYAKLVSDELEGIVR